MVAGMVVCFLCFVYYPSEADSLEVIDSNLCSVSLLIIKVNENVFVFCCCCFLLLLLPEVIVVGDGEQKTAAHPPPPPKMTVKTEDSMQVSGRGRLGQGVGVGVQV